MMDVYIACLLQILSFSSRFRQLEMKNFLLRLTMVAGIPQEFQNLFDFYGPASRQKLFIFANLL